MADQLPSFEELEQLRKTDPAKALEPFRQLWETQGQFRVASRYAYCLRKVGRAEEAISVCRAALEKYPKNLYIESELAWAIYDSKIKPAKEDADLGAILTAANEILKLNPNPMALQRVALSVIQVAKARANWAVVLEWTDKIKPTDLTDKPFEVDGRKGMSDREVWFIAKSNALAKLKRYSEARAVAQEGQTYFPNSVFLARNAALALAGDGHPQEAAVELRSLILKSRADWYVKVDLAEIELQIGNASEAYRLGCEAAQNPQDEEYKLGLFLILARAALVNGQRQIAAEHVILNKIIRKKQGWKIPAEVIQLEEEIQLAIQKAGESLPSIPNDVDELQKVCRKHWREGATAGLAKKTGRLGRIDPNKPFSFIFPDDRSERVFVRLKNIPKHLAIEGQKVEFAIKPSFDPKKGVESVEAVDVRQASR
jgi:tetratricopeptide (TPR) repeat protein/cold shock CspA family protein